LRLLLMWTLEIASIAARWAKHFLLASP
jgi:hypothetical protein